jgi:hypothetical protein
LEPTADITTQQPVKPEAVITPLDEAGEKKLRTRIQATFAEANQNVILLEHLLLEAEERGAWATAGRRSWIDYATKDCGLPQSTAYLGLERAKWRRSLRERGVSNALELTARQVRAVSARRNELVQAIKERVDTGTDTADAIRDVVGEAVKEKKSKARATDRGAAIALNGETAGPTAPDADPRCPECSSALAVHTAATWRLDRSVGVLVDVDAEQVTCDRGHDVTASDVGVEAVSLVRMNLTSAPDVAAEAGADSHE